MIIEIGQMIINHTLLGGSDCSHLIACNCNHQLLIGEAVVVKEARYMLSAKQERA